jgi:hypothetical protein
VGDSAFAAIEFLAAVRLRLDANLFGFTRRGNAHHQAYLLRRERSVAEAKIMISMALDLLIIIRPTT